MTLHFNYWLTGSGWAEVYFTSDKQNLKFEISYLSDPLANLFKALCRLINNQSNIERISFWDEPGEYSLAISKMGKEEINISIYLNKDKEGVSENESSEDMGELLYTDTDTLKAFSLAICTGIDGLLARHTLEEYKEKWVSYEFPLDTYNQLKRLLQY